MSDAQKPTPIIRIWNTLRLVPEGKVVSYGQLADLAGLPGRARLSAKALRVAPREMGLPWHRVIGANGKISIPKDKPGYRLQMELLRSEGVVVNNGKIKMSEYQWHPDVAMLLWQLEY